MLVQATLNIYIVGSLFNPLVVLGYDLICLMLMHVTAHTCLFEYKLEYYLYSCIVTYCAFKLLTCM